MSFEKDISAATRGMTVPQKIATYAFALLLGAAVSLLPAAVLWVLWGAFARPLGWHVLTFGQTYAGMWLLAFIGKTVKP